MIENIDKLCVAQQKIEDVKVLENLLNGNIDLKSIDNEAKVRLIELCKEQLKNVDRKN